MTDALRERVNAAVGSLYQVEAEIGRGGMAVVYRATDTRLRRRVALKVLPPELAFREEVRRRFLREAQMAAQLSHPNIVPIYAVDEASGLVYFAMGLVEGAPLAKLLFDEPRPPIAMVRRVLREVADALHFAHGHGVVHRDIKPDNILVESATGKAVVTDFGIARAAQGEVRLTATGIAVGTPAYMSPEQAMGEREVDGRADIYSLGIVGYQMLAGELPFSAANTPSMLMKHLSEPPRPLLELRPDLPANLAAAIERALCKAPADRWPDAAAFRDALAESAPVTLTGTAAAARAAALVAQAAPSSPAAAYAPRPKAEGALSAPPPASPPPPAPALPPGPSSRRAPADPLNAFGVFRAGRTGAEQDSEIHRWREQQHAWREQLRAAREGLRGDALAAANQQLQQALYPAPLSEDERVRRVRRKLVNYTALTGVLFVVNAATGGAPWFLVPAFFMGVGMFRSVAGLWADDIPLRKLFTRGPRGAAGQAARAQFAGPGVGVRALPAPGSDPLLANVPREVLVGRHGRAITDAIEARRTITDVLEKLPTSEKQLLPDIGPTVTGLVERIISLAGGLHQLDEDASPEAIARLDQRLADARALPGGAPDKERRVTLLERQRQTLADLAGRRETVAAQLDNASLVLDTMKYDLLKLRSSGLQSQMSDATFQTQDARAVVAEIERALEVAEEVQKIR
ncbi:MAG: serine/threonine protein kinase [Gemmatimonadetes bacterium]|nr:serine/threonine protein kinase [Gemmatimonadota bacterium]